MIAPGVTGRLSFPDTLESGSLALVRSVAKSDLHNHCMLGGKRSVMERFYGKKLARFKAVTAGIHDLNSWITQVARPVFELPGGFEKGIEAAFIQARQDGITRLEMSMDVYFGRMFNVPPEQIVSALKSVHTRIAPGIEFLPELGMARSMPVDLLRDCLDSYLPSGYFRGVDLYDDEFSRPVGEFREIYRSARSMGLKCKAHAGEFGPAESVREAVEVLELDAVQHGIGAAESPEVMKWLAVNNVQLNICPASNIRLKRVRSYRTHPARILFDHGVKITINTDDALVFGLGNSEQYLRLHRCGLFSSSELEIIRKDGINAG